MKKAIMIITVMVGLIVAGGNVLADMHHKEHSAKKIRQTQCPITKDKIDKSLYYKYNGKKIYVCCKMCIKKISKNPDKYIKQIEATGVTIDKIQTKCPVLGGEIKNKDLFVDHDGKRVYFCCKMCPGKFKKDPEKYMKKLQNDGIALDYVPGNKHDEKKDKDMGHHNGDHH